MSLSNDGILYESTGGNNTIKNIAARNKVFASAKEDKNIGDSDEIEM